jgi:GT2 family glycosyltransferase
LRRDPDVAVVCGWRRERFPEATLWNRLTDAEWRAGAVGEVRACGGDALMRVVAVAEVGGYREDLIAGEEPEMCFRLRMQGWKIRRIDAAMTHHDAAMTLFSQWWQRARRAGHTYAEGVALHGASPERYKRRELLRTLIWALGLPGLAFAGALFVSPWFLALLLAYPLQIARMIASGMAPAQAVFLTIGKFAELQGVLGYWIFRRKTLIEYK